MSLPQNIGHGVTIVFYEYNGVRAGLVEEHPDQRRPGERCRGSVAFRIPENPRAHPAWDVVQAAPLTLSPSLLCRTCGHHGWIRDGKWVPA